MQINVKKINGDQFTTETEKSISDIYEELSNQLDGSFILLGDRIEQKMTIESIIKE